MKSEVYGRNFKSRAFCDGGIYIMRTDMAYVLFVAHKVGVFGTGPHKHNDTLSFEWCLGAQPVIVDPGTGCYTGDLDKKKRYRSTLSHNTVVVDGEEQIPIEGVMFAFQCVKTDVEVTTWVDNIGESRVTAKHTMNKNKATSVVHQRTMVLDKSTHHVMIEDRFSGEGEHGLEWYFHLDPALNAKCIDNKFIITDAYEEIATIYYSNLVTDACVIIGSVSHRYNEETRSKVLYCKFAGKLNPEQPFCFRMCSD